MALPEFNDAGDLPAAVYRVTVEEALARFGRGSPQREEVTRRLLRILKVARSTGGLDRVIIYGSYVTAKPHPKDVNVVLLMKDGFDWRTCDQEALSLFDHEQAIVAFGANVFWTRPAAMIFDTVETFIESWQIKRGKGRRGVVIIEA